MSFALVNARAETFERFCVLFASSCRWVNVMKLIKASVNKFAGQRYLFASGTHCDLTLGYN